MKYLFTILFLLPFFVVFGQSTKEYKKDTKARENVEKLQEETRSIDDGSNLNKTNVGYYELFDQRRQLLDQNGVPTREIRNDTEIKDLVKFSEDNYRGSFEYNMMQYVFNGKDVDQGSFIMKAYEMNPNDIGSFDEILEYATWKNDIDLEKEVASKIKATNKYDEEIYNYSKDLLSSVPEGAILITSGEIETITGKVLQINDGMYKGITIIKKEWLNEGRYSKDRLLELGLTVTDLVEDLQPDIQKLIESNPQKDFYLSLTLPREELEYMNDRLFLVGLAYRYSIYPIENLDEIEQNWKRIYLKKDVGNSANSPFGSKLLSNYLLSGIKLYYYHVQKGQNTKAKELRAKLYEMALISGHSEKLKAWL